MSIDIFSFCSYQFSNGIVVVNTTKDFLNFRTPEGNVHLLCPSIKKDKKVYQAYGMDLSQDEINRIFKGQLILESCYKKQDSSDPNLEVYKICKSDIWNKNIRRIRRRFPNAYLISNLETAKSFKGLTIPSAEDSSLNKPEFARIFRSDRFLQLF